MLHKITFSLLAFLTLGITQLYALQPEQPYHRGKGTYVFTEYAPFKERPITLHYYIPTKGDYRNMPVLFVIHGQSRAAADYLQAWVGFAERDGFVVICPRYIQELYPSWLYQFGGVTYKGELQPRETWTYNTVEAIFDHFKKHTNSTAEVYDMFGHSAGGQFVHRFALAMPESRANIIVAANPSTWTFPLIDGLPCKFSDKVYGWGVSVKGTPMANEETIKKFFARKLYVQVGTQDIVADKQLAVSLDARSQGENRYERARNFYQTCKKMAKKNGWEFNWQKIEVKGIGHDTPGMVYGKSQLVDGKKQYSIDDYTKTSAYYLIFKKK
ncbi:MAG: hypothetical protein E7148_01575 [Rikenellaceae bacterium]|nr:hypothetical protein [Rikenellaceae bacterium]